MKRSIECLSGVFFLISGPRGLAAADLDVGNANGAGTSTVQTAPDLVSQFADIFRRGAQHPDARSRDSYRAFMKRSFGGTSLCAFIVSANVRGGADGPLAVGFDSGHDCNGDELVRHFTPALLVSADDLKAADLKIIPDFNKGNSAIVVNLRLLPADISLLPDEQVFEAVRKAVVFGSGDNAPPALAQAVAIVNSELAAKEKLERFRAQAERIRKSLLSP